jgi:hypothetical protein
MKSMIAALPGSQLVTIEDQTSPGVLTPRERFNLAWALNYAALYHYGRSPWVTEGLAPAAHVMLLPRGMRPPAGAWNLVLLDTSDQAGALGYHEDEQGSEIPFSDVFVKTAREDGADPAEVACHELYEMLVDPDVSNPRIVFHGGELYIVEVGDPVQGCGYDIGAPEGRTCGVTVADFAWPAWFGLPQSIMPGRMSFRGSIANAFELAPQGYISIAPVSEPGNWSQIFGAQQDRLPAWASRLPRIHGPQVGPSTPTKGSPMTYSATWSGKCRDFPGLPGLVSPPIATLSDADAEHVAHVGHIVEHYLEEHIELECSLSVSGSCDGAGTGSLNLSIGLTPPAAPVAAVQEPAPAEGDTPEGATPERASAVETPSETEAVAETVSTEESAAVETPAEPAPATPVAAATVA